MKITVLFIITAFLFGHNVYSQSKDSSAAGQTAKAYIRQGDYENAIVVLNRAMVNDPENLELKKDLAFAYYLQRNYSKALETAKLLPERRDADVQSFQILGMIYKALENGKDAEKLYKAGLREFPNSGALYNEYGEILWNKKDFADAAAQWEKGIENDPGYSGNYYHAAKYHYMTTEKVWAIIYGEMFVNLESYSKRTPEIKSLLLDAYKKLFGDTDLMKNQDTKNPFVKAYLETMSKEAKLAAGGITQESLLAIRTRFILDWFAGSAAKFPLHLFDFHQHLLKEGMFEAYNQWIFGVAGDLSAFQNWITTHEEAYKRFDYFQKNRVFKVPQGQYYNNKIR